MFENSQTSTIKVMQEKLDQVCSPFESKSASQSQTEESFSSIPMAHREYEKNLRNLELECR